MPLTRHCPKPMVKVNGIPFLQVLLDELPAYGIERVLLLTGYLAGQIEDYFGSQYGSLQIDYSRLPESADTGERVWAARALIDEQFMLMYSDNYSRFSFNRHLENASPDAALHLLVHPKSPGNLVLSGGRVIRYDGSRKDPEARYVELGFMLVDWQQLTPHISASTRNFNEVIVDTIRHGKASATITQPAYFSISDPDRLNLLARYLTPRKVILIDRDGTINQKAPRGEYIYRWEDFTFIDDTVTAMKRLAAQGFEFIVITNQAGIGRGLYQREDVDRLHDRMTTELAGQGVTVSAVYLCPHHWNAQCDCRKPSPGMFLRCEREHQLDLRHVIYIGDDPRDMQAAKNAGSHGLFLHNDDDDIPSVDASLGTVSQLTDAVDDIIAFYQAQRPGAT